MQAIRTERPKTRPAFMPMRSTLLLTGEETISGGLALCGEADDEIDLWAGRPEGAEAWFGGDHFPPRDALRVRVTDAADAAAGPGEQSPRRRQRRTAEATHAADPERVRQHGDKAAVVV